MTTLVKFVIGDWSSDGHGKSETYIVESNVSLAYLRETHFKCPSVLGFDIGDICRDYGECTLPDSIADKLIEAKIITEEEKEGLQDYVEPDEVVHLWLDILMYLDNEINLHIPAQEVIPSIHFYGRDAQNRHLNTPGYGVFD